MKRKKKKEEKKNHTFLSDYIWFKISNYSQTLFERFLWLSKEAVYNMQFCLFCNTSNLSGCNHFNRFFGSVERKKNTLFPK